MRRYFAKTYLALRECLVPTPRHEMQTEVLADLHACIDNLNARVEEMEARVERCGQQAEVCMRLSKKEPTAAGVARKRQEARMALEERRRVDGELLKARRTRHAVQMQIDSISAMHVDTLIVDTMRAYNINASRLSLPARTEQISRLGDELCDRQSELTAMQEALANATQQMDTGALDASEDDIMAELESFIMDDDNPAEAVVSPLQKKEAGARLVVPAEAAVPLPTSTRVQLPSVPTSARPPQPPPVLPPVLVIEGDHHRATTTAQQRKEEEEDHHYGAPLLRRAGEAVPVPG